MSTKEDTQAGTSAEDLRPWGWPKELNPGDSVEGQVLDVTAIDGQYGRYPLLTLDTGVEAHAMSSVLQRELAAKQINIGDRIRITYLGQKELKSGNGSAHIFKVLSLDAKAVDWNQYAESNGEAA